MPEPTGRRAIYLADLGHVRPGQEWTIIPVPLNVGYVGAFLEGMRPGAYELTIFKNPITFLEAVERRPPALAAFSNYIWNRHLQLAAARHVKTIAPATVTVMGGPNYHFGDTAWMQRFLAAHPQIDFHIEGEGEVRFFNLVACLESHGWHPSAVKQAGPAGVAYLEPSGRFVNRPLVSTDGWAALDGVRLDPRSGRLLDLNDVPSPYLTGLLDPFLRDPNYCPIIETNRGCPYECTFCNWGDMGKSKSSKFAQERVEQELRYIADRNVSRTPYLYVGDANFGLFERDVETARLLRELRDTRGFPQNVYLYYAKNSSEKVVRIAEILKGMTRINLSRQTQNPEVLAHIKRSNISLDTFASLTALAQRLGVESFVELIYGLPGESKESFYAGVREMMQQGVDGLHLFPAMLLDGSEMGSAQSRATFGLRGGFRRIDGCAGQYGPIAATEFEEIIVESAVLSRHDYFEIRLFHFFQTLFLDTKLYRATETVIGTAGLFDLIEDVIRHRASAPDAVRELIEAFLAAARSEFVDDPEAVAFTFEPRQAASLVKLNPLFICKLLFDPGVRPAFHAYLRTRIAAFGGATAEAIDRVLSAIDASIYPFDGTTTKVVEVDAPEGRVTLRFDKDVTYQGFLEAMPAEWPLSAKVYEVLLHHSHEIVRAALTWRPPATLTDPGAAAGPSRRVIENEGGWVY